MKLGPRIFFISTLTCCTLYHITSPGVVDSEQLKDDSCGRLRDQSIAGQLHLRPLWQPLV